MKIKLPEMQQIQNEQMGINIEANNRTFIAGQTGSGKTVLELLLLHNLVQKHVPVIIHDIKSELRTGLPVVQTPDMLEQNLQKWKAIHYKPADIDVEDFDKVCEIIYNYGNIMLIVDEISYYCDKNNILHFHKELLVRGRSRGVGMIQLSQRSREIHNTTISESQHLFCFQLILKSDIDKLRAFIPQKYVESIYTLPRFHFYHADTQNNVQFCKPISI